MSREEYEKDVVFTRDRLARIPGNIPDVYAYPCGEHDGHKREVVAKYCIGARGVGGGINIPGRTDYLKTKKGNINAGTLTAMLDEPDNRAYRGWLCEFTHLIGTSKDPETRPATWPSSTKKATERNFPNRSTSTSCAIIRADSTLLNLNIKVVKRL